MKCYSAEEIDHLIIPLGDTVKLESLRIAITPPYLMLVPFLEVPQGIVMEAQYALEEDGVHGCIYHIKAISACKEDLCVGFRDLTTGMNTHQKILHISTC